MANRLNTMLNLTNHTRRTVVGMIKAQTGRAVVLPAVLNAA